GFGDQSLLLRRGNAFLRLARGQQLMHPTECRVNSGGEGKLITDERVSRHSPEPALPSGKRELKQHCVLIEQVALDFGYRDRLGQSQRGVMRARRSNLSFHLAVSRGEFGNLFVE